MVDDNNNDDDVHVNVYCLMKQEKSLSLVDVGYDLNYIEITESPWSYQSRQLNSLIGEVAVDSITGEDRYICSSSTEKAAAISMDA